MYSKQNAWQIMPSTPVNSDGWQTSRARYAHMQAVYPQVPLLTMPPMNKITPRETEDTEKTGLNPNPVVSESPSINFSEGADTEPVSLTPDAEFSALFHQAEQEGLIDLQTLLEMLKKDGNKWTDDRIQNAVKEVVPDLAEDDAKFDHCQAMKIFHKLTNSSIETQSIASDPEAPAVASVFHNRSMCFLMLTVIGVLLIAAVFIAGLSVMWLWFSSQGQNEEYMRVDLGLTEDILQVMVHDAFQDHQEDIAMIFTQTVATLVEDMGYGISNGMGRDGLLFSNRFLGLVIEEWWKQEAAKAVLSTTIVMGQWIEELIGSFGLAKAVELIDLFNNSTMPDGYEMLLGQWADESNQTVRFLTKLRFKDQCLNGRCGSLPTSAIPIRSALAGLTGGARVYDYRPHMVQGGFMYLPTASVGLVYKVDIEVIQDAFVKKLGAIFDALNSMADEGRELVLGRTLADGTKKIVTNMRHCDAACISQAEQTLGSATTPMGRALAGQTGMVESKDLVGNDVLAAFMNVSSINIGVVIKVSQTDYKQNILNTLGNVLNVVNAKLEGTQELELATSDVYNGTLVVRNLTQRKFADECQQGMCNVTEYMQEAAEQCATGLSHSTDYRGQPVVVGYACMPTINSYVSFKVDEREIVQEGLSMAVQSANTLNDNEGESSFELEMGRAKNGSLTSDGVNPQEVEMLTRLRFQDQCKDGVCSHTASAMRHALQDENGIFYGRDYRGKEVLAATSFMDSMGIGLVAKVDMVQLLTPVIDTALLLLGVSLGCLAACSCLLALYTRVMVTSMIRAEKEGQDAIVREKERFSTLVQAMYPPYVVGRVLAGDKQIVEKLPHTAVFFSDIHDFTSTANKISAEDLLQLMGYTYGVMDQISDRFNVTKVKTVGDAYLAICGLPGSDTKNCCLDMLHFASCCAQVFSCKFFHPSQGAVLALLTKRYARKASRGTSLPRESLAPSGTDDSDNEMPRRSVGSKSYGTKSTVTSTHHSSKGQLQKQDAYAGVPKVQCIMSYGIAAGPVTAGVLQGKSPMFDIWGKTVNLASRMQSTGLPGRIQVSEQFYKSVINVSSLEYTFEESHSAMCKGFGLVKSYYVKSSKRPPPKDLQVSLGLEANLGTYYYETLMSGYKKSSKYGSDSKSQTHSVASKTNTRPASSSSSSHDSAHKTSSPRAHPQLTNPSDPLVLLEADEAL